MTRKPTSLSLAAAALLLGLLGGLTGCVGYRLGSMLPPDIKTVYIPTFENKTTEPLIEAECTAAAIRQFQTDGSLRIVGDEQQADSILKVKLTSYTLEPIAYNASRKTTANEYRMTILANLMLTRRDATNQVIAEATMVKGEALTEVTGDFTSTKLLFLPECAKDLAKRLVENVTEAWP